MAGCVSQSSCIWSYQSIPAAGTATGKQLKSPGIPGKWQVTRQCSSGTTRTSRTLIWQCEPRNPNNAEVCFKETLLLYSVLQRWEVAEYFQVCCHVVHDVSMYLQLYSGELYGVGTRSGWRIDTRMPEDTRDVRMQADVCHAAVWHRWRCGCC
jgi:hypothetical protein